ncbi:3-dehydroquinate synthase [Larkinella humicola]|uniref:3-dehydroquinate synthase n=1 Tax=Larkinella humicola TaxID=2607654 RepID=A0A5N1JGZ8_9BACT|nr:3-dehydroquinate synthase [Larkinella humicola]KAA9354984.1 3-dehydroquinate synthase [Larkinella humicola]
MNTLHQSFNVQFTYDVYFSDRLFESANLTLLEFLKKRHSEGFRKKILFILDEGVTTSHPGLPEQIKAYFAPISMVDLVPDLLVIPGGEGAKNDPALVDRLIEAVDRYGIDRHSYVIAIGGGSVLDLVGYVAAISHRGIRHIRIPTTVLSQNDSGIGVKNGVNYRGKKNFLGSFAPPVAVFNDTEFLKTLDDRDWRAGISEAIKVALIKDQPFFEWLETNAEKLAARDLDAMQYLIHRCAELHLDHIASGDPFEMGSSRPLDFGHWSAHKLEQLTDFEIRHGEAVAIGIALDSLYSQRLGWLSETDTHRILHLERTLGFTLFHPALDGDGVLKGLNEFREHLGGQLTIMLLKAIGKGVEVHEMDTELIREAIGILKENEIQPA